MFLDSLRTGLSAEDEPFLEQALTDRSRNVRATAAELLSALPDSALAGRMSARAASCVALDHTSDTPTLTVEAPHECDAGMERDGVVPKPPATGAANAPGGWVNWWSRPRSPPGSPVSATAPRPRSWPSRWPTTGGASCTPRGAVRPYDSGTASGPGRCSAPPRHPTRQDRAPVTRRARQTPRLAARRRAGGLGGRVHSGARPVRGLPVARRLCGALGRAAGTRGRGLIEHRAGRGQLPVELQRSDGPRGTLPGPGGGDTPGSAHGGPRRNGGRVARRGQLLVRGVPAPGDDTPPPRGDTYRTPSTTPRDRATRSPSGRRSRGVVRELSRDCP